MKSNTKTNFLNFSQKLSLLSHHFLLNLSFWNNCCFLHNIYSIIDQYCFFPQSQRMENEFDKVFFQATYENFVSFLFEKQMQTNKMQIEIIRKSQGKVQSISSHPQIIKNCRKSIDFIEALKKEIKQYLGDLKMLQLYSLLQTVFRIMVYDIKKLSQCYLYRFHKNRQQESEKQRMPSDEGIVFSSKMISDRKQFQGRKVPQNEDFQKLGASFVEDSREHEIEMEMKMLISNLEEHRQKIEKINITSHESVFEEVQKIFNEIGKKSQWTFNNCFKQIFQEESRIVYLRPEQLERKIFSQFKESIDEIKKVKIGAMTDILNKALNQRLKQKIQKIKQDLEKDKDKDKDMEKSTEEEKRKIERQNKGKKMKLKKIQSKNSLVDVAESEGFLHGQKERQRQRQKVPHNIKKKQRYFDLAQNFGTLNQIEMKGNISERNVEMTVNIIGKQDQLMRQIQEIRISNKAYQAENELLRQNSKKQASERLKITNEIKQLQKLFKKRTFQLEQCRAQLNWTVQKNFRQSSLLMSRNMELEGKVQNYNKKNMNSKPSLYIKCIYDNEDKQCQTQMTLKHESFPDPVTFQYKSFVTVRSKVRNPSCNENRSQSRIAEAEKQLKIRIQKISQVLFDKKQQQEKLQIQGLLRQQKYQRVIEIIKERLDSICQQTEKSPQNSKKCEQQPPTIANTLKTSKSQQKKPSSSKFKSRNKKQTQKQRQFFRKRKSLIEVGIQTDEKEKTNGFFNTGIYKASTLRTNTKTQNKNFIELNKKRNKMVTLSNCQMANRNMKTMKSERVTPNKGTIWSKKISEENDDQSKVVEIEKGETDKVQTTIFQKNNLSSHHRNNSVTLKKKGVEKIKRTSCLENTLFQQLNFEKGSKKSNYYNRKVMVQKLLDRNREKPNKDEDTIKSRRQQDQRSPFTFRENTNILEIKSDNASHHIQEWLQARKLYQVIPKQNFILKQAQPNEQRYYSQI